MAAMCRKKNDSELALSALIVKRLRIGACTLPVGRDAEVGGAMAGQLVELGERARVAQQLDPLPGGQLAPVVLLGHGLLGSGVHGFVSSPLQVGDLPRGRVRGGTGLGPRADFGGLCR